MIRGFALALVVGVALAGSDARGAVSSTLKANGRIAFAAAGGIASMNPDGSGQWGVELQVGDTSPAWSPDGSQLAVVTHWAGRAGIEAMQPNGSGGRMVTTDGGDSDPAWSPDGGKIAFSNGSNLYEVNADGSGRMALTADVDGYASHPSWSPDGTKIAFAGYKPASGEHVYVLDLTTHTEKALTAGWSYDDDPAWSPDGTKILFVSTRGGSWSIFEMNVDGTGVKQLSTSGNYDRDPAWSPDMTQIAFARNGQVWTMARDGSNQRQLSTGDYNMSPAWQPLGPAPVGCTLWGTSGNDLLVGTDGNDSICGLAGDDTLVGLGGNDQLYGGDGNDYLAGGLGVDALFGENGDDTLDARDGGSDYIDGGAGVDAAIVDRLDRLVHIERPKVDLDLAAWRPVTADAFEPTNPPVMAFDGMIGDWWNSGGYPSHWIEVDLQVPVDIGHVWLVSPEIPLGASVLLLGRADPNEPWRLLHPFAGPFADLQALTYTPKHPWRNVRYLRLEVPYAQGMGWVSWRELAVYPPTPKKARKR